MMPQDTLLEQLKQRRVSEYASPGLRLVAGGLDFVILSVLQFVMAVVLARVVPGVSHPETGRLVVDMFFSPVAIILLTAAYFPVAWALSGRTLAMRLVGLRVVAEATLTPPTPAAALRRFCGFVVSTAALGIPLFITGGDPSGRTWYDKLGGTVVLPE